MNMSREEKKKIKDYQYVAKWCDKSISSNSIFGTLFSGNKINKIVADPKYWDSIIKALKDPNTNTRRGAALIIDRIKKDGNILVDSLIEALKDKDSVTRAYAAFSLKQIGDPRAIEALKKIINDPDEYVRNNVMEALTTIMKINKIAEK